MATQGATIRDTFGLNGASPPVFYSSRGEIDKNAGRYPYTHQIRRAWDEMGLDGIFCVDRRPTVYFKEVRRFDESLLKNLHRKFWNQGVATLLVIAGPSQVKVFSGMARPARDDEPLEDQGRLVELLNRTADALEILNLVKRVETGAIYQDENKAGSFRPDGVVDHYLLGNLRAARDLLSEEMGAENLKSVHALLGRILFTCYLEHREIISREHYESAGGPGVSSLKDLLNHLSPKKAKDALFKLFAVLQDKFNGSMFDDSVEEERGRITPEHVGILRTFLNGQGVGSPQQELFFWEYDFRVIPIETISAIYEDFLAAEDVEEQRGSGAYYTPKHLAEMVVDVALEGVDGLLGKRFLDPACGSGIFLVILLNRLAEEWRRVNPGKQNRTRATALIEILQTHLCGVDKSETACRITCFSLYLALLDQLSPPDIDILGKLRAATGQRVLPPILALKRDGYRKPERPVVFEGNFFSEDLPLSRDFDVVIGNPPWVGRNQENDSAAEDWCLGSSNPYLESAPSGKANRLRYFIPQRQIAHAFMWKTPTHLKPDGRACLLLPTKVFLNKTDAFQAGWFQQVTAERIVQLADWRFILFENAICPAMIVRFLPIRPQRDDSLLEYDVPKVSRSDSRLGVVPIHPEDRKMVEVAAIIRASLENRVTSEWKKHLWGTQRDLRLLDRLLSMPKIREIAGEISAGKRLICGQGFQPFYEENYKKDPKNYGAPKPRWWDDNHPFLDARGSDTDLIVLPSDTRTIGSWPQQLRRSPPPSVFQNPKVVVSQGFSRVAYSDSPLLFQDSIQSIAGKPEDMELLQFLTCYLGSPLARYILFHTSGNWGTERDKVHFWELLELPFPLPEETSSSSRSREILAEVAGRLIALRTNLEQVEFDREQKTDSFRASVNPLVYEYFEVTARDRMIIEDTVNLAEPSATPGARQSKIPMLQPADRSARRVYANTLCDVLNGWGKRSTQRVTAHSNVSARLGVAVLTLSLGKSAPKYVEVESHPQMEDTLRRLRKALRTEAGRFDYLRGLSVFEEDRLHILKPLALRHWTRTAALNDADAIASHILSRGRD